MKDEEILNNGYELLVGYLADEYNGHIPDYIRFKIAAMLIPEFVEILDYAKNKEK